MEWEHAFFCMQSTELGASNYIRRFGMIDFVMHLECNCCTCIVQDVVFKFFIHGHI